MSESASYLTITTQTSAETQLSCFSTFATRESPSGSGAFLCLAAKETAWPKILHWAPSSQFPPREERKTHLHMILSQRTRRQQRGRGTAVPAWTAPVSPGHPPASPGHSPAAPRHLPGIPLHPPEKEKEKKEKVSSQLL